MKVAELEGVLLDCWVAKAEARADIAIDTEIGPVVGRDSLNDAAGDWFEPSTNWAQGGPIIEREIAHLTRHGPTKWSALANGSAPGHGSTPLIAAMRAYVASKFGDEVADRPI